MGIFIHSKLNSGYSKSRNSSTVISACRSMLRKMGLGKSNRSCRGTVSKVKFARMTQLGVASRLMMDHKSGAQKRAQHFSRFQNRKVRRHLCGESYSQRAFVRKPLVRNGLSRFPQPFDMAFDCISCHLLGLCQGTPIRHEPWQNWNCHLKSSFGLRIFPGRGAPLRSFPAGHVASITLIQRQVNHGKCEISRFQFLSLCPIDANLLRHDVSLALC